MAFYEDLTPYCYGGEKSDPKILNVGWLGEGNSFRRGLVPNLFFHKLLKLAEKPQNLHRGKHVCEYCQPPMDLTAADPMYYFTWAAIREGNGQVRVRGESGVVYVAPVLIIHYISEHQYQPPEEFISAVVNAVKI